MTNEEIAEAAKAYAPTSLALRIPTTIREHQKRDIEAAFIAGAKWVIKKLSERTKNQKRNKTMDETVFGKTEKK